MGSSCACVVVPENTEGGVLTGAGAATGTGTGVGVGVGAGIGVGVGVGVGGFFGTSVDVFCVDCFPDWS